MQKFIERFFNINYDASATIIITIIFFVLGNYQISFQFYVVRTINKKPKTMHSSHAQHPVESPVDILRINPL